LIQTFAFGHFPPPFTGEVLSAAKWRGEMRDEEDRFVVKR
jgi:hypothetical protein